MQLLAVRSSATVSCMALSSNECVFCWADNLVAAGERVVYFLGPVPQDKLPKDANPGSSLAGTLKLGLLQGSKEHAPGAFPIFYRHDCQPSFNPLQTLSARMHVNRMYACNGVVPLPLG